MVKGFSDNEVKNDAEIKELKKEKINKKLIWTTKDIIKI